MWRVSGASVSYLNEAARNLQLKYSAVLSGTSERKPRWEECTDLVSGRYVPYTFIINTAKKNQQELPQFYWLAFHGQG